MEKYDPLTNSFTETDAILESCGDDDQAAAVVLLRTGKVFLMRHAATVALYDWLADTIVPGARMASRNMHSVTLLGNGLVLVAGGNEEKVSWTADLYDPANDTVISTARMTTRHGGHTATLLSSGEVLVLGGFDLKTELRSAELLPLPVVP